MSWRRALVLGGIRSGKSDFAESLIAQSLIAQSLIAQSLIAESLIAESSVAEPLVPDSSVVYVATARRIAGDTDWNARIDAHRARRPADWQTVELGDDLTALAGLIEAATPTQTVLVEDLGTWVAGVMEVTESSAVEYRWTELAASIHACPARLVLVSPEVGLSIIASTASARAFADALGATNTAVAAACDRVVLVIAGNAVPVKGGP